ncbi:MAG: 4-hydroxybenzoyl-CoA thioesterase [Verrucomicrobia bacterium]|nr:MAG: 4-hydroxybenzoyl-CoA thioesterase [Verrucomicrobiota bacterium]
MSYSISIKRYVDFFETDMAGIVHFSNYFRWMESAETELFRQLQIPIAKREDSIISGWPKVETNCTFIAPLRFQDQVEIVLTIKEIKNHSLCYNFHFYKIENEKKTEAAKGSMTTVFAKFNLLENTISASLLEEELKNKISTETNQ